MENSPSTVRRHRNPLWSRMPDELERDVRGFHKRVQLEDVVDVDLLIRGARIAQNPTNLAIPGLTKSEKKALVAEKTSEFFQQSKDLKVTILTTACAAITQGWQQSSINASSNFWKCAFGQEHNELLAGLIDAAPWLSGSIIGAWLSDPLQEGKYGRRPALFVSAVFCAACVLGSARCETWQQLLACRLLLGIGIGAKASIAPVFAAEAAVDHLRGRLLMMWQVFDTFGIFLGFAVVWIVDHNWRIVLGSAAIPAIVLLFLVFACPESPRFLIRTNNYQKAYESLRHLRGTDIQAARDLYYIHSQLQTETELLLETPPGNWYSREAYQEVLRNMTFFQRVKALWTKPRNRRACLTAFLVMAAQQFCGINVVSFYSSMLFGTLSAKNSVDSCPSGKPGFTAEDAKTAWLNFGFGLANFLFTLPAYRYIDWRGRRFLLLISLGGMFFSLLAISLFLRIHDANVRLGLVATFTIGFFTFFYGIGAGPVPFTLSAEVFPLAFREVGMSFSVMVNFLGLGLLVLFVPKLITAFGGKDPSDATGQSNLLFLFTGLNVFAFVLVFLFVPSGLARVNLEEMNFIFNTETSRHVQTHLDGLKRVCGGKNRRAGLEYSLDDVHGPVE
ncbi:MFS transporter [Aspergillus ibericus CBS 121593]|uniref:MFS transporter n=1 Tax=Aspergillus ibericus CBS 121593 TaxID=1448316 RepID=A0A395H968_9EURO|nr:MFS transporter [Aspergillus ibericus CBS 121593]RAL04457.1 MFS transporter [Aspergillus ibericus CBS 121593]